MYRIVIAEDESQVRKQIINHINSSDSPYRIVGEAEDGLHALDVIQELRPDILLTDICMPKMSGLELIRNIRQIDPDLPIVVVSGYDEFDYAREAMSMGVREYLLKPFRPQKLFETLDRTKALLEKKKAEKDNLQQINLELQKNLDFVRDRYVRWLIREQGTAAEMERMASQISFPLDADWYCSAIIGLDAPERGIPEDQLGTVMDVVQSMAESGQQGILCSKMEYGKLLLFLWKNGGSRERCLLDAQALLEQVCQFLQAHRSLPVRSVLGSVYNRPESLKQSFYEAHNLWRMALYDVRPVQIAGLHGISKDAADPMNRDALNDLLLHVQMGEKKKALAAVETLFDGFSRFSTEQVEYISISLAKIVFAVSDVVSKTGHDVQVWKDSNMMNYLKKHFVDGSLREAKVVLEEYVLKCCEHFSQSRMEDSDRMIYRLKLLIDSNLANEELSLEMLAELLHYSPNYIRQLFKTKTGENFSDYLLRMRMERAGMLLRCTTERIQDIAEKAGYSNQRYFASCFKKYYGQTPTEYRTQNI